MKLKRCFIALDLSTDAINEIKKIQRFIKNKFIFTGKCTNKENLHLTLKFLGEITQSMINEVIEKLKSINFKEINVELGEVGVFSKDFPRIIWIKINGVDNLQKEIDNKLEKLFRKEYRFMSHVTIARIKHINNKKDFLNYIKSLKFKFSFNLNSFSLKESILCPEKPIYKTIYTRVSEKTNYFSG